jgi:hypothetical protein
MYPVPMLSVENVGEPVENPDYPKRENERDCDRYVFELAHEIAIAVSDQPSVDTTGC